MAQQMGTYSQVILDGTEQTIYTVSADQTFIPKTLILCNVSDNTIPVASLWVLPNGITATADQYLIVNKKAVVNTETLFINLDIFMQVGYKLVIKSDIAGKISSCLSGVVIY